ncbi:MAG: ribosomal L7Ae/L30e/S12e/Gadd45 family protein [Candidatus Woesearchaeota archaeon]
MEDIKKLVKEGKVIIGKEKTLKGLKTGEVSKVFITSNCPEDAKDSVNHNADIGGAEVVQLDMPNDELGVVCRKPFSVSVLGVIKE